MRERQPGSSNKRMYGGAREREKSARSLPDVWRREEKETGETHTRDKNEHVGKPRHGGFTNPGSDVDRCASQANG
jgi:hypothetical protein